MSDKARHAPGRVIRATTKGLGFPPRQQLWAISIGADQEALAHFKWVFPDFEAVEIVGDLSEESLQDLGLKPRELVPL
jgi:hypothetical protein